MTKSTITREQLEEWVAQFDEDGGCDATDRQLEALIRQSLAAMDQKPALHRYRRKAVEPYGPYPRIMRCLLTIRSLLRISKTSIFMLRRQWLQDLR
ncbi:hypothetical protein [Klebsiella pneumoniae]|uniref:hypothetical protein n=1 Tax=Klebsiella pneumoniae TaxID=573 RepID=UPI0022B726E3|nr:hypothetical protein [Klebsiella pneumoniae]